MIASRGSSVYHFHSRVPGVLADRAEPETMGSLRSRVSPESEPGSPDGDIDCDGPMSLRRPQGLG